jgi:creatinine amidohydrolase/Fe(II)-dependent formamide hydrolase-like protein
MLTAIDSDAGRCGYSGDQIRRCLKQLSVKGVHQELPGVQHLGHLLHEKGSLAEPMLGPVAARERPEIMKLRFDPERSPPEAVPTDLRAPLLRILLEHADGAVRKSGRLWIDFKPEIKRVLLRPYEFAAPLPANRQEGDGAGTGDGNFLLGELTWPQAGARFKEVDVALLPVGAVEQHGHHLPLDTDAYDADHLARRVAEACSAPRPLVLPLIPYGVSYHHADFSGTLSVSPDTLSRLVYDVGLSAARHGITKLVILNGHGGNTPALKFAAQLVNRDANIFTCVETGETSDADVQAATETPGDVHAGEIETSTSLATRPHLVRMESAERFVPAFSSRYLDFSSKRSVEWYARTARISDSGVLGDPIRASREKGEKLWDIMVRNLVEFVEDLKRMTLDEIYQRRY